MNESTRGAEAGRRVSVGSLRRGRMLWARVNQALRMDLWFPHVPLALAVALTGAVDLSRWLGSLRSLISLVSVAGQAGGGLHGLTIQGVPQELVGALLILLSLGLLWRSRLAWVLTVLLIAAAVGIQFTPHGHVEPAGLAFYGALLVLLLLARPAFHRPSLATGTLFALVGLLLTIGYGVVGSYALGTGFSPPITDFGSALYFTVITVSTVGYGDITPHTGDARLFTASLIVFGLAMFATSVTAIAGPLLNEHMMSLLQPRKRPVRRKDHIIVVGDNPLARNAGRALTERGIHVTAIWESAPPEHVEVPGDLVIGEGVDVNVLRGANAEEARAVLALGEDDSENAFVALAAKEVNPDVRTVVAVSDASNMGRVRHVRPDVVLALPVIGGELLAMALSGEEINTDELLDQLLRLG
ncbi:MAG TPA: ion channel [Gammaproteobacteria bacterium]|nr:ion channel [Gammaproteobacteria bacterium]